VKNREKYLSPKDLQLIEKKPSRKDKICDLPIMIVDEKLKGDIAKLLEVLNVELKKR
jgi:hypothetical protein